MILMTLTIIELRILISSASELNHSVRLSFFVEL